MASEFAANDRYRAATHNKGIMNGIDAVAIATGDDWRAIEAAVHAYASGDSGYRPLSSWSVDSRHNLVGRLELPLKVGTVGGSLQFNPTVKNLLAILKVQSARELAEVMGAVGLAQNFTSLTIGTRFCCSKEASKSNFGRFTGPTVAAVTHDSVKQPSALLKDVYARSWEYRYRCTISITLPIRPASLKQAPKTNCAQCISAEAMAR